jgi:predicted nucleic acid-binding protein
MDSVVVDSSVAIKWFVVEPLSVDAHRLLNDYQSGAINFIAPDLICAEIGNIVWKKQRLQGLAAVDAQQIIDTFLKFTFTFVSSADLLDAAYHLAVAHQRTVYDALYLALSVRESCRFVTADEKLVNVLGGTFPNVILVANWT